MREPLKKHSIIHKINKIHFKIWKSFNTNKSTQEITLVKSIAIELKNNNEIICKADEGNTAVIFKEYIKNKVK